MRFCWRLLTYISFIITTAGKESNDVFLARASTIPNINVDDVDYPADHIATRHG